MFHFQKIQLFYRSAVVINSCLCVPIFSSPNYLLVNILGTVIERAGCSGITLSIKRCSRCSIGKDHVHIERQFEADLEECFSMPWQTYSLSRSKNVLLTSTLKFHTSHVHFQPLNMLFFLLSYFYL